MYDRENTGNCPVEGNPVTVAGSASSDVAASPIPVSVIQYLGDYAGAFVDILDTFTTGDVVTPNGVDLTGDTDFDVGETAIETATNLVAAIMDSEDPLIAGILTAHNIDWRGDATARVWFRAIARGASGLAITLGQTGDHAVISGSTFEFLYRFQVDAALSDSVVTSLAAAIASALSEIDIAEVTQGTAGEDPWLVEVDSSALPAGAATESTLSATQAAPDADALPSALQVAGGWTGSAIRPLALNSSDQLEIEVVASVLPADAATETTAAAIQAAVEETHADVDAVELPDALQIVGGWTGSAIRPISIDSSDRPVVAVDASALPDGAATEATLAETHATIDADALPASVQMVGGWDGAAIRPIALDGEDCQVMVGLGTAGSEDGGVLTVQGDAAGTPIPVSGPLTDTELRASDVGVTDTANLPADSATVSGLIASSASSITLLAANSDRRKAYIHNTSAYVLYLKYGTSASASSYTATLASGELWACQPGEYTGIICGVWAGTDAGGAHVTETYLA